MGRQEIATFPGPSSPPVGGFQMLQSILETMAPWPATPVQTPARDHDRNVLLKSAYSTPSKRPCAKPSLSASSLANPIDTVQHSSSLAAVLNIPSETEMHPTASESQPPEPDATPISTVINHPGPLADLPLLPNRSLHVLELWLRVENHLLLATDPYADPIPQKILFEIARAPRIHFARNAAFSFRRME